ncbi:hypothetical protein K439DRAFT_1334938, partial [Ramaria rubella]
STFTFCGLKMFHIDSLSSKKSAYDFCDSLCWLTNCLHNAIQNKYHKFMNVMRVWCYLMSIKHSSQSHGIDALLSHWTPGSRAVHCLACPEDEFNMSQN